MAKSHFGTATIKYDGKDYPVTPTLRDIAAWERAGHNVFEIANRLSDGIVDAACIGLFMRDVAVLAGCPASAEYFYDVLLGKHGEDEQTDFQSSMESVFSALNPDNAPKSKKKTRPRKAT